MPEPMKYDAAGWTKNEWKTNLAKILISFVLFVLVTIMVFGAELAYLPWFVGTIIILALSMYGMSERKGKAVATAAVVIMMLANTMYVMREDYPITPVLWITNKFLYVFALAFFLTPIINNWIRTDKRQTVAIVVAMTLLFISFALAFDGLRSPVKCGHYDPISQICTPAAAERALYTAAHMWEDLALGGVVILLGAAFEMSKAQKKYRPAKESNTAKQTA